MPIILSLSCNFAQNLIHFIMNTDDLFIPFEELVPDDVIADLLRLRSALYAIGAIGFLETIDK